MGVGLGRSIINKFIDNTHMKNRSGRVLLNKLYLINFYDASSTAHEAWAVVSPPVASGTGPEAGPESGSRPGHGSSQCKRAHSEISISGGGGSGGGVA